MSVTNSIKLKDLSSKIVLFIHNAGYFKDLLNMYRNDEEAMNNFKYAQKPFAVILMLSLSHNCHNLYRPSSL